jgi:O-succinylhomoserine sulfhydrylase
VSNPTLEVIDWRRWRRWRMRWARWSVVDNVFATPVFSRAVSLGADVVIYSATKHVDGQGRCLGGVILGTREFIRGTIEPYMKHTGGAMSPFNAWVLLNGLTTMDLRVRAQAATAQRLAEALEGHPKLSRRALSRSEEPPATRCGNHKWMVRERSWRWSLPAARGRPSGFSTRCSIVLISNNLGDARSIATHPATTTHQRLPAEQKARLGITEGLVRLSVGLEDAGDLLADLTQALNAS